MASTNVRVLSPRFKVTLFKTVRRETIDGSESVSARYGGTESEIDLSSFFTDQSTISTSKSVNEPAGGFALTLSDQPYSVPGGTDTLYGVIEPMDMVEIRLQHFASGVVEMPVVMRGFVSEVSRGEGVDGEGRPIRTVTINGQYYGKLWQMLQIFYGPGYVVGQDIITAYAMFERFGAEAKIGQTGAEFLEQTLSKILNPYVKNIVAGKSSNPAEITMKALQKHGVTSIAGTQNQEGAIYDLLRRFLDVGTWNELFITEDNDGVYCVYRPNPYLDVSGKPIDPDTPYPIAFNAKNQNPTLLVYHDVFAEDIRSIDLSRSDANVANYYWVRAPRYEMVGDIVSKQAGATGNDLTVDLTKYINSQGTLYGIRKMEVGTEMGGDDVPSTTSGLSEADGIKRDTSVANWIANRRRLLVEMNRDNILLERGSITITGNENIRPGNYLRLHRGSFSAMYYIVGVEHHFSPFNKYETALQLDRGTGFVERLRKNGGIESPYYSELAES